MLFRAILPFCFRQYRRRLTFPARFHLRFVSKIIPGRHRTAGANL
ncbi:hypothetical protein HMPREF1619_02173 [Klebsiella pneumoniae 909957]|nr:hypothetical protein HMPREF1619_02173 [Klebsiella pneumoniae 909957]